MIGLIFLLIFKFVLDFLFSISTVLFVVCCVLCDRLSSKFKSMGPTGLVSRDSKTSSSIFGCQTIKTVLRDL